MYEALEIHLMLALIAGKPDKVARKKQILKLAKKVRPSLKTPLIDTVLNSKTPVSTIFSNIERFQEYEGAAKEVSELGCIGMLIHNNEAIPIQAVPHSEYERKWMLLNEATVAKTAVDIYSKHHDIAGETVTVALLINRGFSGTRYRIVAD